MALLLLERQGMGIRGDQLRRVQGGEVLKGEGKSRTGLGFAEVITDTKLISHVLFGLGCIVFEESFFRLVHCHAQLRCSSVKPRA